MRLVTMANSGKLKMSDRAWTKKFAFYAAFLESMAGDHQQIYGGAAIKREELLEKWLHTLGCDKGIASY